MDMEKNGNISYTGHTANEEVLELIGEERERESPDLGTTRVKQRNWIWHELRGESDSLLRMIIERNNGGLCIWGHYQHGKKNPTNHCHLTLLRVCSSLEAFLIHNHMQSFSLNRWAQLLIKYLAQVVSWVGSNNSPKYWATEWLHPSTALSIRVLMTWGGARWSGVRIIRRNIPDQHINKVTP